jgi:hypothetical protein
MAPVLKAPARPALAPVSGYLEIEGGYAWERNTGSDPRFDVVDRLSGTDSKWLINGAGRVNWWLAPTLSTQFDVWGGFDSFQRQGIPGSTGDFSRGTSASFNIGQHLSYRVPEQYLVGLFGAIGDVSVRPGDCCTRTSFVHGTIGLEAQAYLGPLTLYGQGGVQGNLSDGGNGNGGRGASAGDLSAWFLRGVARYFVNDNLRLEGSAMYGRASGGNISEDFAPVNVVGAGLSRDFKMEHLVWTAGIEKKLDALPLSLFARYQGSWTKFSVFDTGYAPPTTYALRAETTEHMVKVGLRVYLNESTLKFNDRMGTTLDIVDPLTSGYRAIGRSFNCGVCGGGLAF